MDDAAELRDRAIVDVRLGTAAIAVGAVGLSWLFGTLAEAYFSGKPPAVPPVPQIPNLAAPVQKAPPVSVTVVHHTGYPPNSSGAPRPPSTAPKVQPPPPPPVCHSTPSKPC